MAEKSLSPLSEELKQLSELRKLIASFADKGEYINKNSLLMLIQSEDFCSTIFRVISYDKKAPLGKTELLYNVNCNKFERYEMDALIDSIVVIISQVFDPEEMTPEKFKKFWQNQRLNDEFYDALKRNGSLPVSTLLRFLIITFSKCEITWRNVEKLEERWNNTSGFIELSSFSAKLATETPKWFGQGLYHLLVEDDPSIPKEEIIDRILFIICKNSHYQASLLFSFLMQGGHELKLTEMETLIRQGIKENGVVFDDDEISMMCSILLSENQCSENSISTDRLFNLLNNHPELNDSFSISMRQWLLPGEDRPLKSSRVPIIPHTWQCMKNHKADIYFVLATLALLTFSVTKRVSNFRHLVGLDGSPCYELMIARGCGVAINFLAALLILLMCRPLLTRIRMSEVSRYVPVDNHVTYHKVAGMAIFVLATVHTVVHLINIEKNFRPDLKAFIDSNNMSYPYEYRNYTYAEWLLTNKPKVEGAFAGWANPTGSILVIITIIMGIGVSPKIREKGHFEWFYWTHFLYTAFLAIMILHCDQTIKWLLIPLTIFIMCKSSMVLRWIDGRGKTYVVSGVLLPSKVTQLNIRRTDRLNFSPGDWIFINIPSISTFEWHPFTISSAPQQRDIFTLHIRSAGGWTKRLNEYFSEEERQMRLESGDFTEKEHLKYRKSVKERFSNFMSNQSNVSPDSSVDERKRRVLTIRSPSVRPSTHGSEKVKSLSDKFNEIFSSWDDHAKYLAKRPKTVNFRPRLDEVESGLPYRLERPITSHSKARPPLEVYIDGPYGAPSSAVFYGVEHAVLIATGIGVTPFASILQSIMHSYWDLKRQCPNCQYSWTDGFTFDLKKVDFIWINRDHGSFEWFLQLLSQLEMEQSEINKDGPEKETSNFLDIHLYLSSFSPNKDIKAATLKLALDLMHKKGKRDLLTGLKTRTQSGRPDWEQVFADLKKSKLDNTTVFYCGNPGLAETLTQQCNKFGFKFKKEIF